MATNIASLVPLALTYVPDPKLQEGRMIIPLSLNFSQNQQIDPTGTFYTSSFQVQTSNVKSVRVLSSIKSICVKYNTFNNQLLLVKCLETGQSYVLGVPTTIPPANSNFIVNARLPFFLPQNATLTFTNYALATDPPSNNQATVHLCNFEVKINVAVAANPFGNNI